MVPEVGIEPTRGVGSGLQSRNSRGPRVYNVSLLLSRVFPANRSDLIGHLRLVKRSCPNLKFRHVSLHRFIHKRITALEYILRSEGHPCLLPSITFTAHNDKKKGEHLSLLDRRQMTTMITPILLLLRPNTLADH